MKAAKCIMAVLLSATISTGLAVPAMAFQGDILSIDGKNGKIFLNADAEGLNYPLKFLYDTSFWYKQDATTPEPTLKRVLNFLSGRVDDDKFINSALGEKTAEIWYPHMLYEDQMDQGLLDYWAEKGLKKEAFYDDENGDSIVGDYFVYTPTSAEQPENGYPVIVLFHGGGEVAYQTETFGFCDIAAREGIILVAADSWGTGSTDEEFSMNANNILKVLKENYPVDESRIYSVGSSGGGNSAMRFAIANIDEIAAASVMDQPVSLNTRWFTVTDEQVAEMQEKTLPMVWGGGTADCNGLHGILTDNGRGEMTTDFFESSEGAEEQFISGWNSLMKAFGIEGKDITSRLDFLENPANKAEELDGYPFDNVTDIDTTGTSPTYECTMNGSEDMALYLVENRPHMPCGYDAENIWSFISKYSRNAETKKSEKIN